MTYCFDVDGTLAITEGDDYARAKPNHAVIRRVNRLHMEGHRIIVFTARGAESGIDWSDLTERQLAAWGVPFDGLYPKPAADVYVDDRAVNVKDWMEAA
jgi:histidinol phosphatase-like enzyme